MDSINDLNIFEKVHWMFDSMFVLLLFAKFAGILLSIWQAINSRIGSEGEGLQKLLLEGKGLEECYARSA